VISPWARARTTLTIGRLRTLERLGLAQDRQQGVWQLDGKLESKLRRLGERADKFRTMQQVLKEFGIDPRCSRHGPVRARPAQGAANRQGVRRRHGR
jgi:Protein of unknown function (DUF3363)